MHFGGESALSSSILDGFHSTTALSTVWIRYLATSYLGMRAGRSWEVHSADIRRMQLARFMTPLSFFGGKMVELSKAQ